MVIGCRCQLRNVHLSCVNVEEPVLFFQVSKTFRCPLGRPVVNPMAVDQLEWAIHRWQRRAAIRRSTRRPIQPTFTVTRAIPAWCRDQLDNKCRSISPISSTPKAAIHLGHKRTSSTPARATVLPHLRHRPTTTCLPNSIPIGRPITCRTPSSRRTSNRGRDPSR